MAERSAVTVTESGNGPFSQTVIAGRHRLPADEPESRGGQDTGPSPYEYLLIALGACTVITLRMYVQRHEWKLRRIEVELRDEKTPSADGTSMADHFHRIIHLEGDPSGEQRQRLVDLAEKCPVSQTLSHGSVIHSNLASAAS